MERFLEQWQRKERSGREKGKEKREVKIAREGEIWEWEELLGDERGPKDPPDAL